MDTYPQDGANSREHKASRRTYDMSTCLENIQPFEYLVNVS